MWTKKRVKYPHHLKGQSQNKSEVEGNLKENLRIIDTTHLKPKRQMKLTCMIALTIIITMIIILPQVRIVATDLSMVKVVTNNLEVSHKEAEAKDLNNQHQFQNYWFQRGRYQQNCTQYGNSHKPYFQGNQTNNYRGRSHGWGPQQFRGFQCDHDYYSQQQDPMVDEHSNTCTHEYHHIAQNIQDLSDSTQQNDLHSIEENTSSFTYDTETPCDFNIIDQHPAIENAHDTNTSYMPKPSGIHLQ